MNPVIDPRSAFERYRTRGGITILRSAEEVDAHGAVERLIDRLDERQGVLLSSSYDYPGRYTRWDLGFAEPPLELTARGLHLDVKALSPRGALLLAPIRASLERLDALESLEASDTALTARVRPTGERVPEELRSKRPTVFSALRAILELFHSPDDRHLGLYGAFGYDLAFQFEPVRLARPRPADQRDLVLYLPDELLVVDHRKERALQYRYDFEYEGHSTRGLARGGPPAPNRPRLADCASGAAPAPAEPTTVVERGADHAPGEYAASVELAREAFRRGDLFEVVLSQTFHEPCEAPPSELFRRLRDRNPAPYALLLNLGAEEHLVGASPEMYVRVDGDRVETCPISGTAPRGRDAVEDAERIRDLLASEKEESELTMCTDVDRNDKSRICVPGSVKILGRRQIELYSRLIHTVDHVEGRLAPGYDALDAFLTHTWAVTVTGAPKAWAMQFVEDHERSPRAWYGAAIGVLGFDGNMNTGLTLRTVRLRRGRAEVRAGATLLFDSDPAAEERETRLKASAFLDALAAPAAPAPAARVTAAPRPGEGRRLLLVDHQDSFVHTLANYLRQTGAEVTTLRAGFPHAALDELRPDLVVLSPGPGSPSDFDVPGTLGACVTRELPVFGVCLGLQGTVEHFGGELAVLATPVHGKPSSIRVLRAGRLFAGLPAEFRAGRYHSLHAVRDRLPECLEVTAETSDGVVMAIEHRTLPIAAVQFHPESLLTLGGDLGLEILRNVVSTLARR